MRKLRKEKKSIAGMLCFCLAGLSGCCRVVQHPEVNLQFNYVVPADIPFRLTESPSGAVRDDTLLRQVNGYRLMIAKAGPGGSVHVTDSHFKEPALNLLVLAGAEVAKSAEFRFPLTGNFILLLEKGQWRTLPSAPERGPISLLIAPGANGGTQLRLRESGCPVQDLTIASRRLIRGISASHPKK